jgi:hypothetical protein
LEGTLKGTEVARPRDQAKFYLPTGKVALPRIDQHVGTYRVRIERDEITIHPGHLNERELLKPTAATIEAGCEGLGAHC